MVDPPAGDRGLAAQREAFDGRPSEGAGWDAVTVHVAGVVDREGEFAAFVVTAAPALGRTARLLCGDVPRAEDLVQQALVRTYLAWNVAREREPLAYARRVLANLRIDGWRRTRREVLVGPQDLPDSVEGDGAEDRAVRDELVWALQRLTPRRRRVVVLRYVHGLTEREVAETLGVSVAAVKSAGSRGLAQLREVLTEQGTGRSRPTEGRTS